MIQIPVPVGRNKVKTAMHAIVNDISAIQSTLVAQKTFKLVINILNYRFKTKNKKNYKNSN